jgi:SAM-dependent methyltransferase
VEHTHSRSAAGLGERALAEFYDARYEGDYMAQQPPLEVRRVEELLDEVGRPVGSVLDFGCGRGGWVPVLERAFPGAELTGIDISATAIARAAADFPAHRFERFDGERAPSEDGSFDLVFSYHVLEHVRDLEGTTAEIARLLSPGGQACVIFPCGNPGSLEERIVRLGDGGVDGESGRFFFEDPGHLRRMTSDAATALFQREGLRLVRAWFANHLWGAVDFLALVGPRVTGELCRADRARSRADHARLCALRLAFLGLTPFVQAYSVSRPWTRIRRAGTARERLRWSGAAIAKVLAVPVGATVEGLARREWARARERPNGSAQYLLFEKR